MTKGGLYLGVKTMTEKPISFNNGELYLRTSVWNSDVTVVIMDTDVIRSIYLAINDLIEDIDLNSGTRAAAVLHKDMAAFVVSDSSKSLQSIKGLLEKVAGDIEDFIRG